MVEETKEFLVKLFYDEFLLLLIVRNNDKNLEANGGLPLCISDCGPKLERITNHTVGHSYLAEKCKRLISQGFLVQENGKGGRKNLRLSPVVVRLFDCLDEMERDLK